MTKEILFIGIGNEFRQDDGVGWKAAREINAWQEPRVDAKIYNRGAVELIDNWKDYETVLIVDAVISGKAPGSLFRFDIPPRELPATLFCASTHAFNLADVIRLAQALDALPQRLIIFGVEAQSVGHGHGLTPAVEKGMMIILQMIADEFKLSKTWEGAMHEMFLIRDLIKKIEAIAKENNTSRITKAKVRMGALSHISADHLREHFEEGAVGTVAQGAKLDIETASDIQDPHAQDILLISVGVDD
jgi:hydrogenase maturation protease